MGNDLHLVDEMFFKRKSTRQFAEREVEGDLEEFLLKVGYAAPKAGGINCVDIKVIKDPVYKKHCYKAAFYQDSVLNAPLVLVFSGNLKKLGEKYKEPHLTSFIIQNCAVAAMNIINACQIKGLSSCYIGGIRENYLEGLLGFSEEQKICMMLVIGYEK